MAPDHGGRPESNLAVLRVAQSPAETGGLCPGVFLQDLRQLLLALLLGEPLRDGRGHPTPRALPGGNGPTGRSRGEQNNKREGFHSESVADQAAQPWRRRLVVFKPPAKSPIKAPLAIAPAWRAKWADHRPRGFTPGKGLLASIGHDQLRLPLALGLGQTWRCCDADSQRDHVQRKVFHQTRLCPGGSVGQFGGQMRQRSSGPGWNIRSLGASGTQVTRTGRRSVSNSA
jgi:hypothetical protein